MKPAQSISLNTQLNVLLVENDQNKAEDLANALDHSNYQINHISHTGISLLKEVENIQPDIIIIDIDSPDRDMLESLNRISKSSPRPIVMFAEHEEDTDTINQLIKYGVSAYVVGDVNKVRVKSVLDVAMARFNENQGLKKELEVTKQKLTSQKNVEKAKRWLMETKDISETEAYHSIRKMAMNNSQKMDDVAKNILSLAEVLEV
ncbi:MAG: ANTAR domain-containing response regulator [Thalassotalea sp.]